MTSRILSTGILREIILGAYSDTSARGSRDAGEHNFAEDLQPGLPGPLQGVSDDFHGEALVFQVHLDGCDALGGACHLKVHFAVKSSTPLGCR